MKSEKQEARSKKSEDESGLVVREIREEEKDAYNAFVASFPTGHIFQSYEWGEVKSTSGWVPSRYVMERKGEIVGAFSILSRKFPKINKRIFYIPCGPAMDLGDPVAVGIFGDAINDIAKREGAVFLKIDPPVTEDRREVKENLVAAGFKSCSDGTGSFEGIQPRCVMHLDIKGSTDDILNRMEHKWRYNIRLAERKGVNIRTAEGKEDLKAFYKILEVTGKRDGFLIRNLGYFEKLMGTLEPEGMAKMFMADHEGKTIAATIALHFGDRCWYVYGASGNEYRNLMPNHALQWAMIKWAKENGCPVYDFRGIPCDLEPSHPLHGLVRFKKGFGAYPVKYIGEYELKFSRFFSWIHRRGMPVYTHMRKLIRR